MTSVSSDSYLSARTRNCHFPVKRGMVANPRRRPWLTGGGALPEEVRLLRDRGMGIDDRPAMPRPDRRPPSSIAPPGGGSSPGRVQDRTDRRTRSRRQQRLRIGEHHIRPGAGLNRNAPSSPGFMAMTTASSCSHSNPSLVTRSSRTVAPVCRPSAMPYGPVGCVVSTLATPARPGAPRTDAMRWRCGSGAPPSADSPDTAGGAIADRSRRGYRLFVVLEAYKPCHTAENCHRGDHSNSHVRWTRIPRASADPLSSCLTLLRPSLRRTSLRPPSPRSRPPRLRSARGGPCNRPDDRQRAFLKPLFGLAIAAEFVEQRCTEGFTRPL